MSSLVESCVLLCRKDIQALSACKLVPTAPQSSPCNPILAGLKLDLRKDTMTCTEQMCVTTLMESPARCVVLETLLQYHDAVYSHVL
jgi:hypothetical protein